MNDGGPAFPMANVTVLAEDGTSNECASLTHQGMSLRDYFAAKAMQGFASSESEESGHWNSDVAAERAYEWADAMLEARKQFFNKEQ